MGFWALGPHHGRPGRQPGGHHTLPHLAPWQDQFIISGLVCMGVINLAFFFLRELSPQLRDQLMVTEHERALVEARAKGIDVQKATRHPIRSMMKLDLIASSVAISVFLLFYYASVSVLTIYWVVTFNRTTSASQRDQRLASRRSSPAGSSWRASSLTGHGCASPSCSSGRSAAWSCWASSFGRPTTRTRATTPMCW